MSGAEPDVDDGQSIKTRRRVRRTIVVFLGSVLLLAVVVLTGGAYWLDSEGGHKFIISEIEALEPGDGLRIRIGDIEGSIYDQMEIVDLRLADPEGQFFEAGRVALDWNPLAWIFNELSVANAVVSQARLERLPALVDTQEDKPLLPDFDIYLGAFRAENLLLGEAVIGEEQRADLAGAADIRSGRVMINLDAATTRSGDKIILSLNAEPEREKLDLNAEIIAPAQGVIARQLGFKRDYAITIAGEGDWTKWDGNLSMESADQQLAELTLEAREGLFGYDGNIESDLLPKGLAAKIAAPRLVINGNASVEDRLVGLDLAARSPAVRLTATGGIDLARNSVDALRIEFDVRDPSALARNLKAQDLEFKALLNGKFSQLRYQYLLTAPQLAIGKTLLTGVRASGEGRRDSAGFDIPVELAVESLIGNGELLKQLLSGFNGKAFLRLEQGRLFAENAVVRTDNVRGTADIEARLATGEFRIDLDAQAPGFALRRVGIADIIAGLEIGPGAAGLAIDGAVTAKFRRFDNVFLRELGGGLPVVKTGLVLGADRKLRFPGLNVEAPKLSFNGNGVQQSATIFEFTGRGEHDQYGPFDLDLNGPLARPKIAVLLDNPLPAAGLSAVQLDLDPAENGFAFTAAGGSTLGPFTGNGAIITIAGQEARVRVDRLKLSDTLATGVIRPTALGLAGNLAISGGGVSGNVLFEPSQNRQLIRADLTARNARFDGAPPTLIRTGKLDADIVLVEGQSDIDVTVRAQGISRGDLMVGRIAGNAKLVNGTGDANFSIAGTRGSTFNFQAKAEITPDRYVMTGNGLFEGQTLRFVRPLELRRVSGGWAASPTTLRYGNGSTRFSGQWGSGTSRLNMTLSKMPLTLVDIVADDLGLGGEADGTVNLTQTGSQMPTGEAKLNIKGLTRSGLILTSTPIDLGLNIAISGRNAAARGIIQSQAKTIGRFQGRITGFGNGNWRDELQRSPLFAQARFNGAADALWRLTGVETFDLTGPLNLSADVRGTLANPQINGQLRTTNARLESGLTGTVISGIKAQGQFDGSRLVLPNITGSTRGGGSVSGSGSFNFAVAPGEGIGIMLDMKAQQARLIARDDFAATVTGPIQIRSSADGGLISGDLTLNRSFFQFGKASESVALPQIKVTEINRRADERAPVIRSRPWRFALDAKAPNRLQVKGLGLDSEWRASLKVSGPVDDFAMTGSADLIRGNYTFAGRRFQLERGRIRFVGNQPPNPILDIEAEANLTGLNATISVTGRGNSPEIAFNSVPALPEDELLSRVLFGASISDLSAPEAVQLAAAVASLNSGGGLDPINQLRKAVGLDRLRILPSDVDSGQGTSIAAGKYITRRAYVELITDGKGYSATTLEFQITRWLSILSSISTIGRQNVNVQVSKDY
ncbi:translocation/assembly module TamB domain-containing protein [Parasphingorhabdus cellanae]|uniref:Translocation/assembly module TamB domain-containing protein n=1 Tax=Parasphingorhabdus cellanae TaxID=2806553 RepID=A0ABX7T3G3_9SPHN|nr:translocation/assembly module TamB domain-containing protein [Parasphingorhabdus cellanae]QTD54523.1 translocation/assembly module TamB domain-containing protein [Parasphingorhabdus cellanae]